MKIIGFLLLFFIAQSCTAVNTADPQCSPNIKESKRDKLFIAEYFIEKRFDVIEIKEAWLEKVWYNSVKDGKIGKDIDSTYQLVFTLTPAAESVFSLDKLSQWGIIEPKRKFPVGLHMHRSITGKVSQEYFFCTESSEIPDSIMFYVTKTINGKDTKVGDLIFQRKK